MTAADILTELRNAGFEVRVADGRLLVRPPLPPEAIAIVAEYRAEIVTMLADSRKTIIAAVAEVAAIRRWSAADVAEAVALICDPSDWVSLAVLVRTTSDVPPQISAPVHSGANRTSDSAGGILVAARACGAMPGRAAGCSYAQAAIEGVHTLEVTS